MEFAGNFKNAGLFLYLFTYLHNILQIHIYVRDLNITCNYLSYKSNYSLKFDT